TKTKFSLYLTAMISSTDPVLDIWLDWAVPRYCGKVIQWGASSAGYMTAYIRKGMIFFLEEDSNSMPGGRNSVISTAPVTPQESSPGSLTISSTVMIERSLATLIRILYGAGTMISNGKILT